MSAFQNDHRDPGTGLSEQHQPHPPDQGPSKNRPPGSSSLASVIPTSRLRDDHNPRALTTYSTFSYETLRLLEGDAQLFAAANIVAALVAGLGWAFLGVVIGQAIWSWRRSQPALGTYSATTTSHGSAREWPGVDAASLFSDTGHEMATSVLPTFLTSTLHAGPAALGVIEGLSDALVGLSALAGGPLANDPARRGRLASGGYLGSAIATRRSA